MKQTKKKIVWVVAFLGIGSIQVFGKPFATGPYLGQTPPGPAAQSSAADIWMLVVETLLPERVVMSSGRQLQARVSVVPEALSYLVTAVESGGPWLNPPEAVM